MKLFLVAPQRSHPPKSTRFQSTNNVDLTFQLQVIPQILQNINYYFIKKFVLLFPPFFSSNFIKI